MDESFSGLDPVNANVLKEAFLELHQRGKTIIALASLACAWVSSRIYRYCILSYDQRFRLRQLMKIVFELTERRCSQPLATR